MGKKKIEQDLRDAGLRKKHARKVAKAAARGRAGDRAARELVEQHSAALRNSVSAVMSHAKPPTSSAAKKASAKKCSGQEGSGQEGSGQEVIGEEAVGEEVIPEEVLGDEEDLDEAGGRATVDLQVDVAKGADEESPLGSARRLTRTRLSDRDQPWPDRWS